MDRRRMIRVALASGASVLFSRLTPEPAAAGSEEEDLDATAAPAAEFQTGTLRGGDFEGWKAVLAATGQAVRGTVYDPRSLGGARFTGFRVRGVKKGTLLDLDLYDLDDLAFSRPVGGGAGRRRNGRTAVNFEVEANSRTRAMDGGKLVSKPVALDHPDMRALAGGYGAALLDAETGEQVGGFSLTATGAGRFSIQEIELPDSPQLPPQVTGRFGVGKQGAIYTVAALPKLAPGALTFDPSEVNILRPAPVRTAGVGSSPLAFIFTVCLWLDCNQVERVTLSPDGSGAEPGEIIPGAVFMAHEGSQVHDTLVTLSTEPPGGATFDPVYVRIGDLTEAPTRGTFDVMPRVVATATRLIVRASYGGSGAFAHVILRPGGAIYGRVTDTSGRAVPGATVQAVRDDHNDDPGKPLSGGTVQAGTDGAGRYELPPVVPGRHTVTVTGVGIAEATVENVIVAAEERVSVDVRVLPAAATGVRGTVMQAGGDGLPEARVLAIRSGRVVTSGPTGEYLIELPKGSEGLIVTHLGYKTVQVPLFTIPSGGFIEEDVTLPRAPGGGAMKGTVRRAGGRTEPIPGALVVVGGDPPVSTATASDGTYEVSGLSPGSQAIDVRAGGFQEKLLTGIEVRTDEEVVADVYLEAF